MPRNEYDDAPPHDVEQWAASLDDEYLKCRVFRHALSLPSKTEWDSQRQAYRALRRCRRCGAKAYCYYDRNWMIKGTEYDYSVADGFLRPKGSGHLTKEERALLRREAMEYRGRGQ